jgi:chemotaxis protein MotC
MSRRALYAGLCVLGIFIAPTQGRADPSSSTPFEMMRALAILQDQIAAGNAIAQVGQVKMIERMAERFSTIDTAVWKDKRNARALVLYLFGGGNAAALDGLIVKDDIAKGYEVLFEGAMAYALGHDGAARAALLPIDARNLPSGLGGHLALVQATLLANQDKVKALQLLDLARLLEPGTLVEEAALRKEMFLIGSTGDLDKFALLARRYMHGFAKSVYAENFKQLEIKMASDIGKGDSAESNARLEQLLNGVDKRERQDIYLAVAKSAVLEGRPTTASFAGSAAAKLSEKPDSAEARAQVYYGAATVVGSDYDLGVKALNSVDPVRLTDRDAALRASALEIATMIRSRASLLDAADEADVGPDHTGVQQTVVDAEKSLAMSDALLQRATP